MLGVSIICKKFTMPQIGWRGEIKRSITTKTIKNRQTKTTNYTLKCWRKNHWQTADNGNWCHQRSSDKRRFNTAIDCSLEQRVKCMGPRILWWGWEAQSKHRQRGTNWNHIRTFEPQGKKWRHIRWQDNVMGVEGRFSVLVCGDVCVRVVCVERKKLPHLYMCVCVCPCVCLNIIHRFHLCPLCSLFHDSMLLATPAITIDRSNCCSSCILSDSNWHFRMNF